MVRWPDRGTHHSFLLSAIPGSCLEICLLHSLSWTPLFFSGFSCYSVYESACVPIFYYSYLLLRLCLGMLHWVSIICKCIRFLQRKQFLILRKSVLVAPVTWLIVAAGLSAAWESQQNPWFTFWKTRVLTRIPKLSCVSTMLPLYDSNPSLEMYREIVNECLQNASRIFNEKQILVVCLN